MKRLLLVLGASVSLVACQCGTKTCQSTADCSTGEVCSMNACVSANAGGGTGNTGGGGSLVGGGNGNAGGGTGTGGGQTMYTGCDPTAPDNATRDTDCDGLSDDEEYNYPGLNKTDPCNADTDGDGLPDGLELGRTTTVSTTCGNKFVPDADQSSRSDPTNPDTDGDGLKDGEEDLNHDGKLDPGESRPDRKDTDCDGLSDFDEVKGTYGCMTNPQSIDTDGDGLPDGVEEGRSMPGADPVLCAYTPSLFDTDPSTTTSACNPDTDGDGVQDGAEDVNHNGHVDPGELDPNAPGDATMPVQQACTTANLKPIMFESSGFPDVQVALVPTFTEVTRLNDGTAERGIAFYDSTSGVAALVLSQITTSASASADELADRAKIGGVTAPLLRTFTTWDNFPQSVLGSYDLAGAGSDVKTAINNVAKGFLGGNATGLLTPGGGAGPFKVQAEFVHRVATPNSREVVIVAIVPTAQYTGQGIFSLDDVAGGSALAQFGDLTAPTCEVFQSGATASVDFIWDVDDSASMSSSQAAIKSVASTFATKLGSAGLDWRVAGVTTGYYAGNSNGELRAFTSNATTMTDWFDQNQSTWFGISGSGTEEPFPSAEQAINGVWLPRGTDPAANKIRQNAAVHLIILTDTYDQSGIGGMGFANFMTNLAGGAGVVHGIVCPEGASCGDDPVPNTNGPIQVASQLTNGVLGDIRVAKSAGMGDATAQAQLNNYIDQILNVAIAGTGHQLQRPPISATIKVAIEAGGTKGTCNTADMPRDRTNGFDFDSASRRIVFYGNCIPAAAGKQIAVSYKFWEDNSPDPGGDPCGGMCMAPQTCDPGTKTCKCPADCGGCQAPLTCDVTQCACTPGLM